MKNSRDRYRNEIDKIDERIAALINRRLDVAEKIGAYKIAHGLAVTDEVREEAKKDSFADCFADERKGYAISVMEAIMEASRNLQEDRKFEFALLGRRLGHSLSPRVHRLIGGYEYGLIELEEDELEGFFEAFPLKGISVTMPYKRAVMKYCRDLSDSAKATDSVNTIVRKDDGTLIGYNTDYDGFRYTVERSAVDIDGKKCLILGSGGVSGSVKKVLEDLGAGQIVIISRTGSENYDKIQRHCDAEILVNATPVGMYPNTEASPVDIAGFRFCVAVFDLVYNPLKTRLLLDAEGRGIPAYSGLDMLVAQAACACRLFTGEDHTGRIHDVCEGIRRERENIVLIGMPGSGKTRVGRSLAELTGKRFVDSDEIIADTFGMTAAEIIRAEGEDAFRSKEKEVIESIGREGGLVLATGGGVVEKIENRYPLRSNGKIVYVKRDLAKLSPEGRPISESCGVETVYERRKGKYEDWQDITVENLDIDETAKEIKERLGY